MRASVTPLAAPAEVPVEALEDLGCAPLELRQRDRAERRTDVISDQAVVRGMSADADLVLGEPAVEEIAEVGLGSRSLEGVGLGQQTS
jgi:hypothetical protein